MWRSGDFGDYYEDDASATFDDYIPITNDPGPWMFIGVSAYSLFCLLILPFLVICGSRHEKRKLDREEWNKIEAENNGLSFDNSETKEDMEDIGAIETELVENNDNLGTKIKTESTKRMNAEARVRIEMESFFIYFFTFANLF